MSKIKRAIELIYEWGWENNYDVVNMNLGDLAEKYYYATRATHSEDEKGVSRFIESITNSLEK